MYTLADYFKDAGVQDEISFAKFINIDLRDGEGNLCKPRPDQVVALNKALRKNRFGLFDDPGVGKTVVCQAYSLFYIGQGEKAVVMMPPILLEQFRESFIDTFIGVEKYVNIHVLDEGPKKREELFSEWDENNTWPQVVCVTYQMFYKLYQELKKREYNVVISDEAQFLKNPESGTYKRLEKYLGKWEDTAFMPMTGTPIHNELIDAYALIRLLNPGKYDSKRQFERMHCKHKRIKLKNPIVGKNGRKIHGFKKLVGYKDKNLIKQNLYENARRVTKEEVMTLKEPTVVTMPIRLSDEHQRLYKRLAKERVIEMGDEIITALQDQKLRQAMLQIITDPDSYTPEDKRVKNHIFEACRQLCDTVDTSNTKMIFFANYKQSIRALAREFEDMNPAILNGEISNPQVQKRKFLQDDECRLLIANPNSAGMGLNLQSVCHNAVFVEPCSVPGSFKQACERIFRGGQINTVNIWILKVLGTVSPVAITNMLRKEDEIQSINRDPKSILSELLGQAA